MNINRFLLIAVLMLSARVAAPAQDSRIWKRVHTGDDYVIDVNVTSLMFAGDRLQLQIRTVLDKEEIVKDGLGSKSKIRLENIEYTLRQGDYRVAEVVLLDLAGKPILTQSSNAAIWKPLKRGGMMERVLLAARPALPFGKWKVAAYRLAEEHDKKASEESQDLIGVSVSLEAELAQVGQSACGKPLYKSEHYTVTELSRQLNADVKLPELASDSVDLIYVKCESEGWEPPQSMLVKLPEGRMLMLWKGVFLTLKRT